MTEKDYLDNIEAAELQNIDVEPSVISNLEFEKWKLDPDARKQFTDINKDSLLGNLNGSEMTTIYLGENCHVGIKALHGMMASDKRVQDYFLSNELMSFMVRKKASILALSNSKDGFRVKVIQSKFLYKETSDSKGEGDKRPSGFKGLFFKKKEKPQGE